jgi:GNAT superfamily N-acetyltransferase
LISTSLVIERHSSAALSAELTGAVRELCDAAYQSATGPYLESVGPGEHLLGLQGGRLVSHLMWVMRWLQPEGRGPLRTAYVELVATAPTAQRHGYASALLQHVVALVGDFELAALSPATDGLYRRLGWRFWRGPLSVRRDGRIEPTPEERVMIHPLPLTPILDLDVPLSIEWRPGEVW